MRRAGPGDVDAIATLFRACRDRMAYLPRLEAPERVRAWIADVVLARTEVWVAEDGGEVVGFAALSDEMLDHLYVAPEAQGRGIGTRLLAQTKERRPAGFDLWVFQKNEGARRFYERHGLRLTELTDGGGNEENEPDARYEWRPR